jgi:heat shock protein HslJ
MLVLTALTVPASASAQQDPSEDLFWPWQLLEYRADPRDEELTPVPAGIGITAGLFADTLTIEGTCSTARTDFSLQGEESIAITPPAVDSRGCDAEAQAVDDAFYEGLALTRIWQTSGGCDDGSCRPSILTFADEVGQPVMRLTSAILPPDPGLSRWDLSRIGGAEGDIAPVITGVTPWLEFQRGGHVVGSSGCGSFLGDYTINGDTISISNIVPEAPDCTAALRDQAETILGTLGEITDFDILPAGLVLRDASGLTRLAFVPSIDLDNRTWTPIEISRDGTVLDDLSEMLLSTSAVRFAGLQADGRSYCRGFEGDRLSSGLALSVSRLETQGGQRCPARRREPGATPQEIEDGFIGALERTASHALRGDELLLMDVDGAPVMRLIPQAELAGPTWVLEQIETRPDSRRARVRPPVGEDPPRVIFDEIGFLRGNTGVRSFIAEFDVPGGSRIDIVAPATEGPGCGRRAARTPRCVQERLFLEHLEAADVVVVRPFEMRLHQGQRVLLRFIPEDVYLAREAAEAEEVAAEGEDG